MQLPFKSFFTSLVFRSALAGFLLLLNVLVPTAYSYASPLPPTPARASRPLNLYSNFKAGVMFLGLQPTKSTLSVWAMP